MEQKETRVRIQLSYLPAINFVMQQNNASILQGLSIQNTTENPLKDIRIELNFNPHFGEVESIALAQINPNEQLRVELPRLTLSLDYFIQLTERINGELVVRVMSGDNELLNEQYPIAALAFDEWAGISILPEMLSSFVTPNHPTISAILKRTSTILEHWTGNPSLDEYQSKNPDRVRKQMAALYSAICEQEIIYYSVPASFEEHGQRVRLVDAVLSQKIGTCLDMALLYATCLEAIGLHPLLIIEDGHALAGAWLIADTFADSVVEDVSLINKRIADGINEVVLVETTSMNKGKNIQFDEAVTIAHANLNKGFKLAVDVKRARFSRITPIPQRVLSGEQWQLKEETIVREQDLVTPQSINPYDLTNLVDETQMSKQLIWERKLLDLSLRNNLLNLRITKKTLQLISANIGIFEDALANGDEFRILHKPSDWDNPLYSYDLYHSLAETDPIMGMIKSELAQKRLRSYLTENDLGGALTHLYRASRLSIEENGANTLYVALGLLKWYETDASERPRYAPLLLVPVEIIRKSAAKGYVIRSREEDTIINITLLELLRQAYNINIQGLDPLPTDGSGVDVNKIFSIIRYNIKNQPRWDIEEQAILGLFSFNKFIMWNDIHNNAEKLKENVVVKSLLNGKIEWKVEEDNLDLVELDKKVEPADIILPINADSSQLEAVYEASNDKSFILHGPPGTGKSQTITNLISNALYQGKRVLFVAEKMAALSVVQKRLEAIGLAPFCLELHSNKSNKTAVIEQLKRATEVIQGQSPEHYAAKSNQIYKLREELNWYIESIHMVYPFGYSLYDAILRYESIEVEREIPFPINKLANLSKENLAKGIEILERMVSVVNVYGNPYSHPLKEIQISEYSSELQEEATNCLKQAVALINKLKVEIQKIYSFCPSLKSYKGCDGIIALLKICKRLQSIPELTASLVKNANLTETIRLYKNEVSTHGVHRDKLKQQIIASYHTDILSIDASLLLQEWQSVTSKWLLPRLLGQKKIKKILKRYAIQDQIVNPEILLLQIKQYQEEEKHIHNYEADLPRLFGSIGRNENEDWDAILQVLDEVEWMNTTLLSLTKDIKQATQIKQELSDGLVEGIAVFKTMYGTTLSNLSELSDSLNTIEEKLGGILGVKRSAANSTDWFTESVEKYQLWLQHIEQLKGWYQWLLIERELDEAGFAFVPNALKSNNILNNEILNAFNKGFYKSVIDYIFKENSKLVLFNGLLFKERIDKYRRLADFFQELTKRELFAKLAGELPSFTIEASQNSEVGILQRNLRNNARGVSIRKLFDLLPTLLPRLCPCMLMSPMSVAQYIDIDADKFDIVVFDEASQMPTSQAVGAIARGNNVVVVGDPKQMPPTTFFAANVVDEDNIEVEDLESVLEDCLALSMPSKHLLWHYRSKHESLIAFSNSEYYDDKLLTFPSPDNIESKVRLVQVSGEYDKGRTRQNRAEANAIVKEIVRRLTNSELNKKSIGVVTFSMAQQTLIENLLHEIYVENPDIESLALDREEPIFIKNLENVQGDERDIILFSIGYGPDKYGNVSMNFGPLNRLGGERRLNVAVSRSRYEMIIYSTLRSDQIDLRKTSAKGVAGLKHFLEYAQYGNKIVKTTTQQVKDYSIAHLIAKALRNRGYKVDLNIGSSGYKIDIGIIDEKNPHRYKLGIICDGENFRNTKMVRDREIVQPAVLTTLGWKIYRVWTLDWWDRPQEVLDGIEEALSSNCLEDVDLEREPFTPEVTSFTKLRELVDEKISSINNTPDDIKLTQPNTIILELYKGAALAYAQLDKNDFYNNEHVGDILKQLEEVMEKEAPICKELLYKRVLAAWNISKLGQRLERYLDDLMAETAWYISKREEQVFYWKSKDHFDNYTGFRIENRNANELPPEEIANGMRYLIEKEFSMPKADLIKSTAQLFGFARRGQVVEAVMNDGFKIALSRGVLKYENNRVRIA